MPRLGDDDWEFAGPAGHHLPQIRLELRKQNDCTLQLAKCDINKVGFLVSSERSSSCHCVTTQYSDLKLFARIPPTSLKFLLSFKALPCSYSKLEV